MDSVPEKNQPIYINGRKAAVFRNFGTLCDIRRRSNGFLYSGGVMRVAVSEELLEMLGDSVLLQFTNLDSKDVYTITVKDFRRMAQPVQFAGFEPQRAAEVSRMAHRGGGRPRKNEPVHIEYEPVKPEASQIRMFS